MSQLLLPGVPPPPPPAPSPWAKYGDSKRKHVAYVHVSGWRVDHCGHPTANYPYYLTSPTGELVVSASGHGFLTVAAAKAAAEHAANGGAIERCPEGEHIAALHADAAGRTGVRGPTPCDCSWYRCERCGKRVRRREADSVHGRIACPAAVCRGVPGTLRRVEVAQ